MGPQTRIVCAANLIDQVDFISIEEAVFQSDIPAIAQWRTNACKQLPCKTGIRIIKIRAGKDVRYFGPCNADAAASKALDAVIVAKVQQAVQHEAERIDFTIDCGWAKKVRPAAAYGLWDTRRIGLYSVGSCCFITNFSFQTETAEIITNDTIKVVTSVMINFRRAVVTSYVDRQIFSDHCTALNTDVPLVITSQCRCSERCGGKRHS